MNQRFIRCAVVALVALLLATPATAQVQLRVDGDDGIANGDGLTWQTAYKYLSDAIAAAHNIADDPSDIEIWVAASSNPYKKGTKDTHS